MSILIIIALLLFKHFICDFIMQTHYQLAHKNVYAHPGGLLHAILHGIGTFIVMLLYYSLETTFICACLDAVIHYHIDWAKAKLNNALKFKINGKTERGFWALYGLDQLLHQLTYVGLVFFASFL